MTPPRRSRRWSTSSWTWDVPEILAKLQKKIDEQLAGKSADKVKVARERAARLRAVVDLAK